jgi:hypothetical protein
MESVEITTHGIRRALEKYDVARAIAEYIWNGFDAQATQVDLSFESNPIGGISALSVSDNGYGIAFQHLGFKFKPFFESDKQINPASRRRTSAVHGRTGVGRLTFHKFAQEARWVTTHQYEAGRQTYDIWVSTETLDRYEASRPEPTVEPVGTIVRFTGIFDLTLSDLESGVFEYLQREFGWFLELNRDRAFSLTMNGVSLAFEDIIGEREEFPYRDPDTGDEFEVRYVRWESKINDEYSRYYMIDSNGKERRSYCTTLNNKGDRFYHSVYIKSGFFDNYIWLDDRKDQEALPPLQESSAVLKRLQGVVDRFLKTKRKPFIRRYAAEQLIRNLQQSGAFPEFGPDDWDQRRSTELKDLVVSLYQVQPRIFSKLNHEQEKTFVYLLNLVMDSGERESLFKILSQIIQLDKDERAELSSLLQVSRLSSIIKTIRLLEDRKVAIDHLRDLVFRPEFGANERDHVQKVVEAHYWIFGEQYHLVTAADQKFEEALHRHIFQVRGQNRKPRIDHPDKRGEMDIFLVRQLQNPYDMINNVVIELKHPRLKLGERELSQVKRYHRVIQSAPDFNANNMSWEFYLVGNDFDGSGFIEGEIESHRHLGERSLAHLVPRCKIYVKRWSEMFTDFDIRFKFLYDRLKLERQRMGSSAATAREVIEGLRDNMAAQPAPVVVPTS